MATTSPSPSRPNRKATRLATRSSSTTQYAITATVRCSFPRSQSDTACSSTPHLWAVLEDGAGKHHVAGFLGGGQGAKECSAVSLSDWLTKDAVLLKPQQSVSGTFLFPFAPGRFTRELKPGRYRLEASLCEWNAQFTESQHRELDGIPGALLIGETPAAPVFIDINKACPPRRSPPPSPTNRPATWYGAASARLLHSEELHPRTR